MSTRAPQADVAVVGLGPAGRSLAASCVRDGLRVTVIDPAPDRTWTATYGAFASQLSELSRPVPVAAVVTRPVVRTTTGGSSAVAGSYHVLDTGAVQAGLDLSGAHVVRARAASLATDTVGTADGDEVRARVVVDARGADARGRTVQTAFGVVVPTATAEPLLAGADGVFMDWRRHHGSPTGAPPTFCYVVPLDSDRVLLEETSLAARPGPSSAELRARLLSRLHHHGVELRGNEVTERVRFALDTPLPTAEWLGRAPGVLRLGAAAPVVHPATGYSVATSFLLAEQVASALASGADAREAHRAVWPTSARLVHALRLRGLRALTAFDSEETDRFFAAFFALGPREQRVYLAGRTDALGTAAAMRALLPHLDPALRRRLIGAAVLPGGPAARR